MCWADIASWLFRQQETETAPALRYHTPSPSAQPRSNHTGNALIEWHGPRNDCDNDPVKNLIWQVDMAEWSPRCTCPSAGHLKGDNAAPASLAAEAPVVGSISEKGGDRRYGEEN